MDGKKCTVEATKKKYRTKISSLAETMEQPSSKLPWELEKLKRKRL